MNVQRVQDLQEGKANHQFFRKPCAGHREVSGETSLAKARRRARSVEGLGGRRTRDMPDTHDPGKARADRCHGGVPCTGRCRRTRASAPLAWNPVLRTSPDAAGQELRREGPCKASARRFMATRRKPTIRATWRTPRVPLPVPGTSRRSPAGPASVSACAVSAGRLRHRATILDAACGGDLICI